MKLVIPTSDVVLRLRHTSEVKIFGYMMVKILVVLLAIVALIITPGVKKILHLGGEERYVEIGGQKILVEVADSLEKRTKGLSDRDSLSSDHGLLFIFPNRDYHAFWNYHLKFPIDVFWIDNGIIVDKTTLPIDNGQPITYTPKAAATHVLEVNAGLAEQYGWGIGTKLISNI